MNRPGTPNGNWHWRVTPERLTSRLADELRHGCELADRLLTTTRAI